MLNDVVDAFGRLDRDRDHNLSQDHMSPLPQLGTVSKLNKTESAQENLHLASSGATKKVRMQDGIVVREPRHAPQHPFDSKEYTLQSHTNAPIF